MMLGKFCSCRNGLSLSDAPEQWDQKSRSHGVGMDGIFLLDGLEYRHRPEIFLCIASEFRLHLICVNNMKIKYIGVYTFIDVILGFVGRSRLFWSGLRRNRTKPRRAESLKVVVLVVPLIAVSVRENSWTWRGGGQVVGLCETGTGLRG